MRCSAPCCSADSISTSRFSAWYSNSLFQLTDEGWRKLTWRWTIFFFALAVLNEIVWRNTSTNFWVDFKVFGVVPLTFLFAALQAPLLKKYAAETVPAGE